MRLKLGSSKRESDALTDLGEDSCPQTQFKPRSLSGMVSTLHVLSEHPLGSDQNIPLFEELPSFFNSLQVKHLSMFG